LATDSFIASVISVSIVEIASKDSPVNINHQGIEAKPQLFFKQAIIDDYPFSHYLEQGRFAKSFEDFDSLGSGGFGSVFQVKHRLD
jgi:hypothetical protein